VGRVMQTLDELQLTDNTVLIFTSDNGGVGGYHREGIERHSEITDNAPLRSGKGSLYEGGTRVPLIVRVPGRKSAGSASPALVELVDLYPTLAELCGLPVSSALEGKSFVPLLDDLGRPWKQAAFSEYLRRGPEGYHGRSIRTADLRYTEWIDKQGRSGGVELYDYRVDPRETKNVAGEARYADEVKKLAALLKAGP